MHEHRSIAFGISGLHPVNGVDFKTKMEKKFSLHEENHVLVLIDQANNKKNAVILPLT